MLQNLERNEGLTGAIQKISKSRIVPKKVGGGAKGDP